MMTFLRHPSAAPVSGRIAKLRKGLVLRSNSLLVTMFGDAFAPRHQAIWLGSLIEIMRPFGVAPRSVRTSCSRLASGAWLEASRIGRRSYYALTETGALRVAHADRRIFEFRLPGWDGNWTLVVPDERMRGSILKSLGHDLRWQGFGRLARNVFAHPQADIEALSEILYAYRASSTTAVLNAAHNSDFAFNALAGVMQHSFVLDEVDAAWKQFVERFLPLGAERSLTPAESFYARTLLIHEYRRVLLRDPNLPAPLLPPDWSGLKARALCEDLYRRLVPPSEEYLRDRVETDQGELLPTPNAILCRLGGKGSRA